jgi:superfamily II DNA or RNA helicase
MVEFITTNKRAFLFGGIGTGKTLTMLWAADWLMSNDHPGGAVTKRLLFLVPKSTKLDVWGKELYATFPHRKYIAPEGSKRHEKILEHGDGVLVLNHDAIRNKDVEAAVIKWNPGIVAVDESTAYKEWGTARTKAIRRIVKACEPEYLWYATGTPMPQSPMDMYGQAKMICPEAIPATKREFQQRTMFQVTQFKWVPKRNAVEKVYDWIKDYAYRVALEDTTVKIPDAKFGMMRAESTTEQRKLVAQLKRDALVELECEGRISAVNEGVFMSKMLQIAGGSVIVETDDERRTYTAVDAEPKYDALRQVQRAASGPVIVFASYQSHVDELKKFFRREGKKVDVVDGRVTSSRKRAEIFQAFQDGNLDVLVANPAAMAHGITLTASNIVVWWSLPYKAETYEQANGRIRRIGQGRQQYYIHLVCSDASTTSTSFAAMLRL